MSANQKKKETPFTEDFWKRLFDSDYYKDNQNKINYSLEDYFDKEGLALEKEIIELTDKDVVTPIKEYFEQVYSYEDLIIFNLGSIVCAHCKKSTGPEALISPPYNITDTRGEYVDTILWCSDCLVTHWDILAPNNLLEDLNCSANAQRRIEYWGLNADRFAELLSYGSSEKQIEKVKSIDCSLCKVRMDKKILNNQYSFKVRKAQRFVGPLITKKKYDGYNSLKFMGEGSGW